MTKVQQLRQAQPRTLMKAATFRSSCSPRRLGTALQRMRRKTLPMVDPIELEAEEAKEG